MTTLSIFVWTLRDVFSLVALGIAVAAIVFAGLVQAWCAVSDWLRRVRRKP